MGNSYIPDGFVPTMKVVLEVHYLLTHGPLCGKRLEESQQYQVGIELKTLWHPDLLSIHKEWLHHGCLGNACTTVFDAHVMEKVF